MNADAFDEFNAGTIMGYRGDNWETIKQFSGLWKSNMRLQTVTTWQLLLPGIEMDRLEAYKSTNLFGLIFYWSANPLIAPHVALRLHLLSANPFRQTVLLVMRRLFKWLVIFMRAFDYMRQDFLLLWPNRFLSSSYFLVLLRKSS